MSNHGRQESDAPKRVADVGILFVHGIGAQERGETLAQFGEPICAWLADRFGGLDRSWRKAIADHPKQADLAQWRGRIEGWASDGFHDGDAPADDLALRESIMQVATTLQTGTVVARAGLSGAAITGAEDGTVPAHATLRIGRQRIEGDVETEEWLLAESWWAKTFLPATFADLAGWGLRVMPWIIGSHFGAEMRSALASRPVSMTNASRWRRIGLNLLWAMQLLASLVKLLLGLVLSPFALVALAGLLIAGMLPIERVRQTLLNIQLKLASTVGDSYVLLSRPIEAASIVGQVRRDMAWLAGRCKMMVIVAHSQGAAVTHQALRDGIPARLQLFVTFGSGLKKLEQVKALLSSGHSYRLSAVFTLTALLLLTVTFAWLALVYFNLQALQASTDMLGEVVMMGLLLVVSAMFLLAGIRDYLRGIELPELQRWIVRLKRLTEARLARQAPPFEWLDCFATADPVSNGFLMDDREVKALSAQVCNESSILKDHTSYWTNRDEFLTLLFDRLAQPRLRSPAGVPPAPDMKTEKGVFERIAARRRWRIGIASAIGWIAVVSVLLALLKNPQACLNFLVYMMDQLGTWGRKLMGVEVKSANQFGVAWATIGYLALVLVPYWIARRLWRSWNEEEMRALIRGQPPSGQLFVSVFIVFQLVIAAGLVYGDFPPWWLFMPIMVGPPIVIALFEPSMAAGAHKKEGETESEMQISQAEQLFQEFVVTLFPLALPFSFGLLLWKGIAWLVEQYFAGSIFGFRLSDFPGEMMMGGVLVLLWLLIRPRTTRRVAVSPRPGSSAS